MSDWADEIAGELVRADYGEDGPCGIDVSTDEIAAALRKARADGMRKAADYAESSCLALNADDSTGAVQEYIAELRHDANLIEQGK